MGDTNYFEKAEQVKNETREALETILGALNHGQRQKLLNNSRVLNLLKDLG